MGLGKLIKEGESNTLEFKENFDKETIETAAAFANARGGTILIGISDTGEIKGSSPGKESLKEWANQISQSTEPSLIPEIGAEKVNGRTIVCIRIAEFPIKPVSVKGRCFRRVGNSNRAMSPQGIAQMHLDSTGMNWDALPARDTSISDIDAEKIERYIRAANASGRRRIGKGEKPLKVLEKLELIKNGKPTWAAVLLFGKKPQSLLSQTRIHCGRFRGKTTVIDDRMIEGSVIEQVDDAMDFIRKNINVEFVMTGELTREEVWDYPLEALREVIVNAACHRDYSSPSNVEIRIYDDELVTWSPGGLPSGITLEDLYKLHRSVLRNKKIAGVFYDIGWIEQWGSGIDKMRKACVNAGLPEPVFEEYQGFRVIFRKDIYTEEYLRGLGLNERQIKAVMHVKEKRRITNKEYQQLCNVRKRQATDDLKELEGKGIFERVGKTGKGTYYVLKGRRRGKTGIKGAPKGRGAD